MLCLAQRDADKYAGRPRWSTSVAHGCKALPTWCLHVGRPHKRPTATNITNMQSDKQSAAQHSIRSLLSQVHHYWQTCIVNGLLQSSQNSIQSLWVARTHTANTRCQHTTTCNHWWPLATTGYSTYKTVLQKSTFLPLRSYYNISTHPAPPQSLISPHGCIAQNNAAASILAASNLRLASLHELHAWAAACCSW